MDFISILFLGIGLAMDAFAVSVTKGLAVRHLRFRFVLKMALCFGVAQAVMPLLGFTLGHGFAEYIVRISPIVSFGLLAFVGIKMIIECVKEGACEEECSPEPDTVTLIMLAIATSIDALAAGLSLALVPSMPNSLTILPSVFIIGVVTTVLCIAGAYVGRLFGCKIKKGAAIIGGVVLVAIGVKMLLQL